MNEKDIIKITKIENIKIKNTHNDFEYPLQSILKVETREGGSRIIDLMADRDITDIDYLVVKETPKTKEKILFKEYEA